MRTKTKGWSEKRRRKQAENIRKTRPWEKTTGPRTQAGKAAAARNARKHGLRSAEVTELRRVLRAHAARLRALAHAKYLPAERFSLGSLPKYDKSVPLELKRDA